MNKNTIFVYEDNNLILEALNIFLEEKFGSRFEILMAKTEKESFSLLENFDKKNNGIIEVAILDTYLGTNTLVGPSIAKKIREIEQKTPIIAISGDPSAKEKWEQFERDNFLFLKKPFDFEYLKKNIEEYINRDKNI